MAENETTVTDNVDQTTDESNKADDPETESPFSAELEDKANKILLAVNRILDSNDKIRAVCKKCKRQAMLASDDDEDDEKAIYMDAGKRIITHYSDRASISGGLTSLPAMVPGIGTVATLVGTSAVDLVLMLKFEVEMSLCLCHLAGFDINDERNRQLAFALATVSSRDILANQNEEPHSTGIVQSAFWDYSVRQLSKHILRNITAILCLNLTRGMIKTLPFVGIAVGASFNKVMTKRTGLCCLDAFWLRRYLPAKQLAPENDDTVYDAEILD